MDVGFESTRGYPCSTWNERKISCYKHPFRRAYLSTSLKSRINLGAVVKQLHLNKEYVILEKDGIPIAALMDVDEFEDYLELQDPKVKKDIAISN
jgi:hypothetical protein